MRNLIMLILLSVLLYSCSILAMNPVGETYVITESEGRLGKFYRYRVEADSKDFWYFYSEIEYEVGDEVCIIVEPKNE